jgi:hypothetical protein
MLHPLPSLLVASARIIVLTINAGQDTPFLASPEAAIASGCRITVLLLPKTLIG